MVRIHNIRQDIIALKSQYKEAGESERTGLAQLMGFLQKKIRVLRRAEWHQRCRRERARRCAAFIADSFKFTRELLGQKRSGKLVCSQEEMNQYLSNTYSDPKREQDLGQCDILIDPPEPSTQFDLSELQLKEVIEVVPKARAGSAPGPSNTSYKVYKNCSKLLFHLWKILRVIWRRGKIPEQSQSSFPPLGSKLNPDRPVLHNLPAERRSKDLLQHCFQPTVYQFGREHLHRYNSTER